MCEGSFIQRWQYTHHWSKEIWSTGRGKDLLQKTNSADGCEYLKHFGQNDEFIVCGNAPVHVDLKKMLMENNLSAPVLSFSNLYSAL